MSVDTAHEADAIFNLTEKRKCQKVFSSYCRMEKGEQCCDFICSRRVYAGRSADFQA